MSSDDIVDRLRQWFDYAPIANFGDLDDDIAEAADEIERLRASLTPEDIGMVQVPIEDQATDRPLWGFPR